HRVVRRFQIVMKRLFFVLCMAAVAQISYSQSLEERLAATKMKDSSEFAEIIRQGDSMIKWLDALVNLVVSGSETSQKWPDHVLADLFSGVTPYHEEFGLPPDSYRRIADHYLIEMYYLSDEPKKKLCAKTYWNLRPGNLPKRLRLNED